jgi:hypothetical protein
MSNRMVRPVSTSVEIRGQGSWALDKSGTKPNQGGLMAITAERFAHDIVTGWSNSSRQQTHIPVASVRNGPELAKLQAAYLEYSRAEHNPLQCQFIVEVDGEKVYLNVLITGIVNRFGCPPGTDIIGARVMSVNGNDIPTIPASPSGAHVTIMFCRPRGGARRGYVYVRPEF